MAWLIVAFLGACLFLAVMGVYAYQTAEANDYAKLLTTIRELKGEFSELKNAHDLLLDKNPIQRIEHLESEFRECEKDLDEAHEHMAKIRESQHLLNMREHPKVELTLSKPIEVQIIEKEISGKAPFTGPWAPKPMELKPENMKKVPRSAKPILKKLKKQLKDL